jgi:soluble lytic murein transglycosylase-like protein
VPDLSQSRKESKNLLAQSERRKINMRAQHYAQLLLMGISLPWFIPAHTRPGKPAPPITSPYTDPSFQQAFFDAAKTYGKKGCGDKQLAELTATVSIKNGVPANLMAAIVGIESSCNPYANNGIAVGIGQVNVLAHKDEYDFSKINLFNTEENLEVSAEILAKSLKVWGLRQGVMHYNGVGPTAEKYAMDVLALAGR